MKHQEWYHDRTSHIQTERQTNRQDVKKKEWTYEVNLENVADRMQSEFITPPSTAWDTAEGGGHLLPIIKPLC